MATDPRLAQVMAELAEHPPEDLDDTLEALTLAVCTVVDGVDFASISVVEHIEGRPRLSTLAPTDPMAAELDELQDKLAEGPCYDAAVEDRIFVAEDLAEDPRWPQYGPAAADLGVTSQMGVDIHRRGTNRAALNLYSRSRQPFVDAVDTAEIFAAQACLMLGMSDTVTQLHAAMGNRKVIGQALGILMERYNLDEDRAFRFLTRTSQQANRKLRNVAAEIVAGTDTRNKA
jgi:hypothetical protein